MAYCTDRHTYNTLHKACCKPLSVCEEYLARSETENPSPLYSYLHISKQTDIESPTTASVLKLVANTGKDLKTNQEIMLS
jgi:hypothetical protein